MADIELIDRDVRDHAKTISEIITRQQATDERLRRIENDRMTEAAVGIERRGNLDERLDRIEANIAQVYGLGKWVMAGVGSVLIATVVGFVVKGGLLG